MSFHFRIWFSGLCHFVENKLGNFPGVRCKMCVVLPQAKRHVCEVKIRKGKGTIKDSHGAAVAKIELNRHRLVFDIKGATSEFQFGSGGIGGVLELGRIADVFIDENPEIVSDNPPPESRVLGQVLLEKGLFYSGGGSFKWKIPGTLTGGEESREVARELFLEAADTDSVRLIVTPFGVDSGAHYIIDPGTGGIVDLLVSNDCRDSINGRVRSEIDDDFVYHYELLHKDIRSAIDEAVGGPEKRPLPIREDNIQSSAILEGRVSRTRAGDLEAAQSKLSRMFAGDLDKLDLDEFELSVLRSDVGCNCLGCYAQPRVLYLDRFLPSLSNSSPAQMSDKPLELVDMTSKSSGDTAAETPPRAAGKPARRSRGGRTRK